MYTCGPTVYNFAHIGNFRAYTFEDVLRRAIRFCGMGVKQVMNLTDVDDKTIRNAINHPSPLGRDKMIVPKVRRRISAIGKGVSRRELCNLLL
jgi:cysteinyl-tRNA synthetase